MNRTINTATELEALPVGSGLIDKYGDLGLIDNIIGIEGQRVVQYAETGPMALEYVAKHYLPATIVHDPSAPVPVVSDAAVVAATEAVKAHSGPMGDPDEGTLCNCGAVVAPVGEYGVRAWREHVAGAALAAVLPHLGAAPSATREELSALLLTFLRPPKHGGSWTYSPDEAADALLARFTITPKETDR